MLGKIRRCKSENGKYEYSDVQQQDIRGLDDLVNTDDDVFGGQTLFATTDDDTNNCLLNETEISQLRVRNKRIKNGFVKKLKEKWKICICLACVIACIVGFFISKTIFECEEKGETPSNTTGETHHTNTKKDPEKIVKVSCYIEYKSEKSISGAISFEDRCIIGSEFVKDYCDSDKSRHRCEECNELWLPKFCFCDKSVQCSSDIDHLRKITCGKCQQELYCPCINRGNCTCRNKAQTADNNIRCECPHGYTGHYCEDEIHYVDRYRMCSPSFIEAEIVCDSTTTAPCTIFSTYFNRSVTCTLLKENSAVEELERCL